MAVWKREKFTYRNPYTPNDPRLAEGYTHGSFGIHKIGGYWRLVHLPSGFEVDGQFHGSLKQAKAGAEQIASLTDWNRSRDEICVTTGLMDAVRRTLHPDRYA